MTIHPLPLRPARKPLAGVLVACALLASPAIHRSAAQPPAQDAGSGEALRAQMRQLIASARDQVFPALVNISVVTVDYWQGKETKGRATGSGTIISADGYVLTNAHVTDSGKKFTCTLSDKSELPATLVGEDPWTDLAVLKLDLKNFSGTLHSAKLGDSDMVTVGDSVMAMGSPFSLSRSVTLGIVSNTERVFAGNDEEFEGMTLDFDQRTGLFARWIQHDASINPGNSGGPLLNLDGQVVGINSAIITRTGGSIGIGFAIPANMARAVMENIIDSGRPQRGYLGAGGSDLDQKRAAGIGLGVSAGAVIESVMPDSPADRAGLRVGDVVTSFGGKPVDSFNRLRNAIAFTPPGENVPIEIVRDGKRRTLSAEVVDREKFLEAAYKEETIDELGISVTNAIRVGTRSGAEPDSQGVQVSSMRRSGPAFREGVRPGDLIIAVDEQLVRNVGELKERLGRADWSNGVVLEIERMGFGRGTVVIRR